MSSAAPVGATKKDRLPLAISVAVLALGATACGERPPQNNPDGGCRLDCNLYPQVDGGQVCLC
jgi:hypothetical protein